MDSQIQGIERSATVYDIRLINIPVEIIQNIGWLDAVKLTLYCTYLGIGYDLLNKIAFPCPIADIVSQHGECFDGSGFPHRIKGKDILIKARILAVADALIFDRSQELSERLSTQ